MELRFRTDPNEPGTEKLTVAAPMTAWLEAEYKPLPHLDPGPLDFEAEGLPMSSPAAFVSYHILESLRIFFQSLTLAGLPPFSVAYVKGWRRSLACLIVLEGIRVLGVDMEELTPAFKAGVTAYVIAYVICHPH